METSRLLERTEEYEKEIIPKVLSLGRRLGAGLSKWPQREFRSNHITKEGCKSSAKQIMGCKM